MSTRRLIFKFRLTAHRTTAHVGQNPVVRHVEIQEGVTCAWIEFDADSPMNQAVELVDVYTGEQFELLDDMRYCGTASFGRIVVHVYSRNV